MGVQGPFPCLMSTWVSPLIPPHSPSPALLPHCNPGLSTHVNASGVEGTVGHQYQKFGASESAGSQQCPALGGKGHGDRGQEAQGTGQREKGTGHARAKHCPALDGGGHRSMDVRLGPVRSASLPPGRLDPSRWPLPLPYPSSPSQEEPRTRGMLGR